MPQRDAFVAGDAPVFFFHSGTEEESIDHDSAEAERALDVLSEEQKPEVIFCAGPRHVAQIVNDRGVDALSSKLVVDEVAEMAASKILVDADTLWYLNSKEGLARSGLPTPRAEIIEVKGHCPQPCRCCEACEDAASSGDILFPETYRGPRRRWLEDQRLRTLCAVESQPLPFVFKNQQNFGGAGTYIITNGSERKQLLEALT